jgi:hypothetical protein
MNLDKLTTRIAYRVFNRLYRSGLIGADDASKVAYTAVYTAQAGDGIGDIFVIRRGFLADAGGGLWTGNDVPIFDSSHPAPCSFRVLDAILYTTTNVGARTVTVTQTTVPGGVTTNVTSALSANATGMVRNNALTGTVDVVAGSYMTASRGGGAGANGIAGEIVLICMKTG